MTESIVLDGEPWTESKFLEIGVAPHFVQLFDGSLFLSPDRTPIHQHFCGGLVAAMFAAAESADLYCLHMVAIRLRPQRIPIPDCVVISRTDLHQTVFDASVVQLVGEVLSPASATIDEVLKMHYYAEAGIPWYLLVDPRTATLRLYRLDDGAYLEHATAVPGKPLALTEPVAVTIDPADLLPRR